MLSSNNIQNSLAGPVCVRVAQCQQASKAAAKVRNERARGTKTRKSRIGSTGGRKENFRVTSLAATER